MMIETLRTVIGGVILQVYLVMWPPHHEASIAEVDVSILLDLRIGDKPVRLKVTTSDDAWSPEAILSNPTSLSPLLPGNDFPRRMNSWMRGNQEGDFDFETYDMSREQGWSRFIGSVIEQVYLVGTSRRTPRNLNTADVFGIKIVTSEGTILSIPGVHGNQVSTSFFHSDCDLSSFSRLGTVWHHPVVGNGES